MMPTPDGIAGRALGCPDRGDGQSTIDIRNPESTIREHLRCRRLQRAAPSGRPVRSVTLKPNEHWIGDVLIGPFVPYPRVP